MHNDKTKISINIKELEGKIAERNKSQDRSQLHFAVFKQPPVWNISSNKVPEIFHKNLKNLAKRRAVVSSSISHWTDLENFKSIINTNAFLGNEELKKRNIKFEKNAFGINDEKYGDAAIICFCPGFVDIEALIKLTIKTIRQDLIRLTINLNEAKIYGSFNQFFKLYDLMAPAFDYKVQINTNFSVRFVKKNRKDNLTCYFSLDEQSLEIPFAKEEVIFYGNLEEINFFCLTRLFYLLDKAKNMGCTEQVQNFINYFSVLSEEEFVKLIVIFSQSLTIYSEYNFNKELKLTENLIEEIYFSENNSIISLKKFSIEEKTDILNKILLGQIKCGSKQLTDKPLVEIETVDTEIKSKILQYGVPMNYLIFCEYYMEADYSQISPALINGVDYFEARPGLNKDLFSKLTFKGETLLDDAEEYYKTM